jgi:hypothetical protein
MASLKNKLIKRFLLLFLVLFTKQDGTAGEFAFEEQHRSYPESCIVSSSTKETIEGLPYVPQRGTYALPPSPLTSAQLLSNNYTLATEAKTNATKSYCTEHKSFYPNIKTHIHEYFYLVH